MEKTKIILDSTSDIPRSWLEKFDIELVPLHIIWPNGDSEPDDTRDEKELMVFYKKLENSEAIPKTSQPSVKQFQEAYLKAKEEGYDNILVLTISSQMSGTSNSALLAASEVDIPVKVIDTKMASSSIPLIARYARELLNKGLSLDEVSEKILEMRKNKKFHAIFFVSDFNFLVKGGRINKIQGFMGNLLKLKVGIFINENGEMIPFDKVRGAKKAYQMILRKMEEEGIKIGQKIGLIGVHCNAKEDIDEMLKMIKERYNVEYFEYANTGKVISTHVGLKMAGFGVEILD
ncbi:MAG: DegV family protein [Thermosipho sp. (in: Bacteria)]|nr:DegV family protein [Thermosipho sp. (in: thermotogales)]